MNLYFQLLHQIVSREGQISVTVFWKFGLKSNSYVPVHCSIFSAMLICIRRICNFEVRVFNLRDLIQHNFMLKLVIVPETSF